MDRQSRTLYRNGRKVILPPDGHGTRWSGSSHEDTWESLRADNARMLERRGVVAA